LIVDDTLRERIASRRNAGKAIRFPCGHTN
jgi:hypothetical protein